MEIFTLAYDTDYGTGATVHVTEREAHLHLIQENVSEENREEALKQLDRDGEDGFDFWEWFDENERGPMDTFSIDSHTIDVPAPFNNRELATTLYALRELQGEMHETNDVLAEMKDSPHFEDCEPLTEDEIDTLCERLNLGPEQPPKRKVLIQVKGGVAEVMDCPEDVDVTCEDFDPEEKANWESAGRIIKEEKRQLGIIKARAGIIPHDPQDDEPDPFCIECGDNLTEEDAPDDGTDPAEATCKSCRDKLSGKMNCEACQKQHGVCPQTAGCPCCEHAAAMDAMEAEESSLPPDPEGQNADRAEWAHRAILAFESATRTEREDALADLLCDLMHWANVYGQDFDRELSRATDSYAEEIEPEPDVFDQIAEHFKPIVAAEKVITIDPVEVAALADKLGEIL
jgi:hypothetical protein